MTDDARRQAKAVDILGRKQTRTATVEFDAMAQRAEGDDRIPVALSSEAPVDRWFGREILVHTREAIDLAYAPDGHLPFLDGHDGDRQIGLIEDVRLGDDGKLRGMLRQGNHPDAPWIFADIRAGIRKNLSVGYRINELKLDESKDGGPDVYRATRWTPLEGSTVSIPADISVGVGRGVDEKPEPLVIPIRFEIEQETKAEPATEARAETTKAPQGEERTRKVSEPINTDGAAPAHKPGPVAVGTNEKQREMAEITRLCAAHGCAERAGDFIEQGIGIEAVKARLFDEKVAQARPVTVPGHLDLSEREQAQYSIVRAVKMQLDQTWEKAGGLEKEVSDTIAKRINRATSGFYLPLDMKVRAAVTGNVAGTSSLGGAGVQTTILSLIDLLRNRMLVRQLGARVLSGLQGNISFPRQITANTMAWEGENPATAHANTAATLDNVTLSPKTAMASSAYSRQLFVQNSFDVNAFIMDDLATVLALGLDLAALDGTGSNNQPKGIMRQDNVNTATFTGTDGGVPTWEELVAFETAVATDNADIGTINWVTTPGVRGKLKTVLKSTTAGSTYLWESDNTINGYRAWATNQMPSNYTAGTNTTAAHGVLFGVFSEALIGEWGGAAEFVVDPYTSAKQNMVEITAMLMADIAVRHPGAFCVNKTALIS